MTLDECDAERARRKDRAASASVDEQRRSITVDVCCRSVRKQIKDLRFCLAALYLFTQLTTFHEEHKALSQQRETDAQV